MPEQSEHVEQHPAESISSVVSWAASGGLCPHWCKDTRTGPHWHDFVESLQAAGYDVFVQAVAASGSHPESGQS